MHKTEYTTFKYYGITLTCQCRIETFQDESGTADHLSLIAVSVGDDEQDIIDILSENDVDRIQAICAEKFL